MSETSCNYQPPCRVEYGSGPRNVDRANTYVVLCPRHGAVETLERQVIALRTELNHSVLCTVYQEECDKVEALERLNAKLHEMVIDVNSVMMSERGHRFENIMRSFQTRIDALLAESTPLPSPDRCDVCGWESTPMTEEK